MSMLKATRQTNRGSHTRIIPLKFRVASQVRSQLFSKEARTLENMINLTQPGQCHLLQAVSDGITDDQCPTDDGSAHDNTQQDRQTGPPIVLDGQDE